MQTYRAVQPLYIMTFSIIYARLASPQKLKRGDHKKKQGNLPKSWLLHRVPFAGRPPTADTDRSTFKMDMKCPLFRRALNHLHRPPVYPETLLDIHRW